MWFSSKVKFTGLILYFVLWISCQRSTNEPLRPHKNSVRDKSLHFLLFSLDVRWGGFVWDTDLDPMPQIFSCWSRLEDCRMIMGFLVSLSCTVVLCNGTGNMNDWFHRTKYVLTALKRHNQVTLLIKEDIFKKMCMS